MTWRPPRPRFARPAFLTASLAASLTVCSACGGDRPATPTLARVDAQPLAALARKIAGEGACAQRRDIALLQQRTVRLVNLRRLPAELQEPLVSGVNALAADTPPCVPSVPVQATPPAPKPHGHEKPEKHGHKHGHGKND